MNFHSDWMHAYLKDGTRLTKVYLDANEASPILLLRNDEKECLFVCVWPW